MKENKLKEMSMNFSVKIINLVRELTEEREFIISNQIGRSGTSIGANICEAEYAQSKADFVSKLHIALKETNETTYWIELLFRTKYIDDDFYSDILNECGRLRRLLISSINTAKGNLN